MTMPPSSVSGDIRSRLARAAPRRKSDSAAATVEAVNYDNEEFPVLLRMPDISRALTAVGVPAPAGQRSQDQGSAPETNRLSAITANGIASAFSYGGHRDRANLPWRINALTVKRFWTTPAPRIALGGMLLGVTALCVVLLQGTSPSATPVDEASPWLTEPDVNLQSDSTADGTDRSDGAGGASLSGAQPWPSKPNSVAAKPDFPQPLGMSNAQELSGLPIMGMSKEPPNSSWSGGSSVAPYGPTTPSGSATQPVSGWPDDSPASANAPELDLNPAAANMPRGEPATVQTSLREVVPMNHPSSPSELGGARLNGTVEVPNPGVNYRL